VGFGEVLPQPVGIPRRPIGIVTVDDPMHEVVGFASLVQQRSKVCGAVIHGDLVCLICSSCSEAKRPTRTSDSSYSSHFE